MNLHLTRDDRAGVIRFEGEITHEELARLRLDSFDRTLLARCVPGAPAHDYLLALEAIFHAAKEQGITP